MCEVVVVHCLRCTQINQELHDQIYLQLRIIKMNRDQQSISPVIPVIFIDIVRDKFRDCSKDTDVLLRPLDTSSWLIVVCSSNGTDSKKLTILFNSSPIFSKYFQISLYHELHTYFK